MADHLRRIRGVDIGPHPGILCGSRDIDIYSTVGAPFLATRQDVHELRAGSNDDPGGAIDEGAALEHIRHGPLEIRVRERPWLADLVSHRDELPLLQPSITRPGSVPLPLIAERLLEHQTERVRQIRRVDGAIGIEVCRRIRGPPRSKNQVGGGCRARAKLEAGHSRP